MTAYSGLDGITRRNVAEIAEMERASIRNRTRGERIADLVAAWVGSWAFLIIQSTLLAAWMVVNALKTFANWDVYPFVLLNLVLSFQAAFATPIILMSGNRQARLNEQRNQVDLQINLLAEQENTEQLRLLRMVCEKLGIQVGNGNQSAFEEATRPDEII